jgi:hypothetical protein
MAGQLKETEGLCLWIMEERKKRATTISYTTALAEEGLTKETINADG